MNNAASVGGVSIVRETHLPNIDLYKSSDGIVKVITADELSLNVNESQRIADAINEFTHMTPHLLMIIPGQNTSIDKTT